MADIKKVTKSLDSIYNRLGGWMTVSELDTITEAKELLKEQQAEIKRLKEQQPVLCKDCQMRKNNICHNPNTFGAIVTGMYFCADAVPKAGEQE